jgi:hypothetical protein
MLQISWPPNKIEDDWTYSVILPRPDLEDNHQMNRKMNIRQTRDHSLRVFLEECHVDQVAVLTNYTFSKVLSTTYEATRQFLLSDTIGKYFRLSYFHTNTQYLREGTTKYSRMDKRQPEEDWYCILMDETFTGELEPEVDACTGLGLYRFSFTVKRWSLIYPLVNDGGYRTRDEDTYTTPRGPVL